MSRRLIAIVTIIVLSRAILVLAETEKSNKSDYYITSYFNQCSDENFSKIKPGMKSSDVRKLIGGQQYMPENLSSCDFTPYRFTTNSAGYYTVVVYNSYRGIIDFFVSETKALQVCYDNNYKVVDSIVCHVERRIYPKEGWPQPRARTRHDISRLGI